jgi:hypothetical protein
MKFGSLKFWTDSVTTGVGAVGVRQAIRRAAGPVFRGAKKTIKEVVPTMDWAGAIKGGRVTYQDKPRWRSTSPGGPHIDRDAGSGDGLIWITGTEDWHNAPHCKPGGYYVSSGFLSGVFNSTQSTATNYQTFTHTSSIWGDTYFPDTWESWHAYDWIPREHDAYTENHVGHVDPTTRIAMECMQIGHEDDILQIDHNNGWWEYDLDTNEQVWIAPIDVNPEVGDPDDTYRDSNGVPNHGNTQFWVGNEPGMHSHFDGQIWNIKDEYGRRISPNPDYLPYYYDDISDWWLGNSEIQNLLDHGLIWQDGSRSEAKYRHWFDTPENEKFCMLHPSPYMAIRHKAAYEVCDVSNLNVGDISPNSVLFEFIPNFHYGANEQYVYEDAPIVVKNYPPSVEDAPDHPTAGGSQTKKACVVLYNRSRFWKDSDKFSNIQDMKGLFSGKDYRTSRHIRHYAGNSSRHCPTHIALGGRLTTTLLTAVAPHEEEEIPKSPPRKYKKPIVVGFGEDVFNQSRLLIEMTLTPGKNAFFRPIINETAPPQSTICEDKPYLVFPASGKPGALPRGLKLQNQSPHSKSSTGDTDVYITGYIPQNTNPGTYQSTCTIRKPCDPTYSHTVIVEFVITEPNVWHHPFISTIGNFDVSSPVNMTMVVGVPFSVVATARDLNTDPDVDPTDDIFWSASGLPPGMSINSISGELSGTPTETGNWPAQISVTNGNFTESKTITIIVNELP